MNTLNHSEPIVVTNENDLRTLFKNQLYHDDHLRWTPTFHTGEHYESFTLTFDDEQHKFLAAYHVQPTAAWLEKFTSQTHDSYCPNRLLLTVELTHRILAVCKTYNISAIDLNGRTWLRAPGLLIERPKSGNHYLQPSVQPKDIFHGKSARILRALLHNADRVWTHSELRNHTETSAGLTSRIIQFLTHQGYVERLSYQEFRLRHAEPLLEEWKKADQFHLRTQTYRFAGYFGSIQKLPELLHKLLQTQPNLPIVFTQWIAAYFRRPYTEPIICSAYIPRLPDQDILEKLNLQQVSEGGNIWFHIPDDPSFFTETQQHRELLLSTDAQIYLDLQNAGLRSEDTAIALKQSPDFCRPLPLKAPYE